MKKSWLLVCLVNFFIAALMGLLLRLAYIFPVNINYRYMVHAHSHTAMLGWAYMIIFSLFVKHFVPQEKTGKYNLLFWLTQFTVVGMMISFSIQGYALFSITFSTLHIFCSYYFFYLARKDINQSKSPSYQMMRAALLFMVISTAGAWSLGAVGATGGKSTPLYYSSLQFFLHFQFNGWLIFAVLALFFKYLEHKGLTFSSKWFKIFFATLIIATALTMALPLSWYYPYPALGYLNTLGIGVQLIALGALIKLIWPLKNELYLSLPKTRLLLLLPLLSLLLKMGMQALTAFPEVATASHTVRNFTIGFIHLAMLGVVTGFLFFFISGFKTILSRAGATLFYTGFIGTELLLFIQGLNHFLLKEPLPGYFTLLFAASILLPAGLLLITAAAVQEISGIKAGTHANFSRSET